MRTTISSIAVVAITLVTSLFGSSVAGAEPAPRYGPMQHNSLAAQVYAQLHPDELPMGVNDYSCRSRPDSPNPVVLLNGTGDNAYVNWSMYAPYLRANGFCPFVTDYGKIPGIPVPQVGPISRSALEISAFIDKVLAKTGSQKVDLIGHSQGSILALYYINRLGGAKKVGSMIGVEPDVNGVGFFGSVDAAVGNPLTRSLLSNVPVTLDFQRDSDFMIATRKGGLTRPGVRYVSIISTVDIVLTVPEAAFPPGPNTTNIVTQHICPADQVWHDGAMYDDITLRLVLNALTPHKTKPIKCHPVLPFLENGGTP